ncbi:tegument protein [Equid alphaherpesvirus 1]|uniref:Tegument protein VP16 homolog n=1 Tax=Equid alphaherpesvirus 1 TaxID=10326 RepID=A0A076JSP8_9ALPH|nr:tegument protein [Equid alphaherpesvirus 1]AII81743.1 tegument protein [Equid alphaherpesvirus 1]
MFAAAEEYDDPYPGESGYNDTCEIMDMDGAVASFDEGMLSAIESVYSIPTKKRLALPPPKAASPSALYQRLQGELGFPEGQTLLSAMEKWNEDMFSALPGHVDLYTEIVLLSTSVDEVVRAGLDSLPTPSHYSPEVDLNAHGDEPFPEVPALEDDLEIYVISAQRFYLSELRTREEHYARLLRGYCVALLHYLYGSAKRQLRGSGSDASLMHKFKQVVRDRYYREAANLARLLYLHLYVSVTREVSWRLHASQVINQGVFVSLHYTWAQRRKFECLFHPVLFNHGVVILENDPLEFHDLQRINYRRRELGLPLIRAGLIEEENSPLEAEPLFSGKLPRTIGFLTHQIRTKMEAYSDAHPATPLFPLAEHSYSKRIGGRPSYGTTTEAMMDPPSPSAVLPGDPVPPLTVGVRQTAATLAIPSNLTLQSMETDGLDYSSMTGDELNQMFDI